jgi:hypothetical protein
MGVKFFQDHDIRVMCFKYVRDMQVDLKKPLLERVFDIRLNSPCLKDLDAASFDFHDAISRGDEAGINA